MARVKIKELFWDESPAADVVAHRVYYSQGSNAPVTYDSPFVEVGAESSARIDAVLDGQEEGIFSFGVSAIDDAGNESDIHQSPAWVNVPLDVTAPGPVTNGGIRDS